MFTRGVTLLDDCEGTLAWSKSGTGSDFSVAYDTAAAFVGLKGLHLATKTTTPAEDDYVRVYRYLEWTETGLLVVRARFASPDISDVKEIHAIITNDDGSFLHQGEVKWDSSDGRVKRRTGSAAWQNTAVLSGALADGQWNSMEIVVDVTEEKWVYVRMFGQKVDLSDAGLWWNSGAGGYKALSVEFTCVAVGANVAELYVDQIYVGEHIDL